MYILRTVAKFVGGQYTGQTRRQKVMDKLPIDRIGNFMAD